MYTSLLRVVKLNQDMPCFSNNIILLINISAIWRCSGMCISGAYLIKCGHPRSCSFSAYLPRVHTALKFVQQFSGTEKSLEKVKSWKMVKSLEYYYYILGLLLCSRRSSLSRSSFSRHPSPCTAFSQSLLVNSLWWRIQGEWAVKAHIFACTTWPETLWSCGIMRPRD